MYVASLELSRTLFELSGWDDVNYWHVNTGLNFAGVHLVADVGFMDMHKDYDKQAPAYDLGYLLQKLPQDNIGINLTVLKDGFSIIGVSKQTGTIGEQAEEWESLPEVTADTPENAACSLVINLIEQGIIQPREGLK